jgi:arabinan endo-1,5-alpha-L-arabinosidase
MLGSIFITCATFLPLLPLVAQLAYGAPTTHTTPFADGYPMPEPCLGNCTSIHDPSIVYENGMYWRFTTQNGINIANAPSLEGPWTYRGALLTNGTKIDLYESQEIWVGSRNLAAKCIH